MMPAADKSPAGRSPLEKAKHVPHPPLSLLDDTCRNLANRNSQANEVGQGVIKLVLVVPDDENTEDVPDEVITHNWRARGMLPILRSAIMDNMNQESARGKANEELQATSGGLSLS